MCINEIATICKIGDRLELQIRSLEMSGRIVPLALDAYDTDGLPGIYCPESFRQTRLHLRQNLPHPRPGIPRVLL